jgi:hypothetical protein
MFKKGDCIRQYLFPLQVFFIHYFYQFVFIRSKLLVYKTNLFLFLKVKSYFFLIVTKDC